MTVTKKDKRTLLNISVKKFIDDYVYRIDLDADYQREKIWSAKQQEGLLDSILIDIDIPKMYLVEVKDNKTEHLNLFVQFTLNIFNQKHSH